MGDKGNISHFIAEKHWLTMRNLKEIKKVLFLLPLIQEQLLFLFKTNQKGQEGAKEGNTMFITMEQPGLVEGAPCPWHGVELDGL